jgi:hypothetical protein
MIDPDPGLDLGLDPGLDLGLDPGLESIVMTSGTRLGLGSSIVITGDRLSKLLKVL